MSNVRTATLGGSADPSELARLVDLDQLAAGFVEQADRLWPDEPSWHRLAAALEELGEVSRAILKRDEALLGTSDRGLEADEWTANLRTELGQLLGVVLDMLHREGMSAHDAAMATLGALSERRR